MTLLLNVLLLLMVSLLAIPTAVLCLECLLALLAPQRDRTQQEAETDGSQLRQRPQIAVLVPAHNEQSVIRQTLEQLQDQLAETDRLVVVADNCTDATAQIARTSGAEVLERVDPDHRGKGYALDFGVRHLQQQPPDVVLIMDADCMAEAGAISKAAEVALASDKPAQTTYLMEIPRNPGVREAVSGLAFMVKNLVRPLGLKQIGAPCHLMGTGMAFPWKLMTEASLAGGNIVEDMQLGIDLAVAKHPPLFLPAARVTSMFPETSSAAGSQRTRWEHGHLQTLLSQVPRLLKQAILQRRPSLLVMALDLAVPPLALLSILLASSLCISMLALLETASYLPMMIAGISITALAASVTGAWYKFARQSIPAKALLSVPAYIAWKIPIYIRFVFNRQRAWVRTQREAESET